MQTLSPLINCKIKKVLTGPHSPEEVILLPEPSACALSSDFATKPKRQAENDQSRQGNDGPKERIFETVVWLRRIKSGCCGCGCGTGCSGGVVGIWF